ncbi:PucR family transcriptional regulator [Nocardioides sp. Kera G14]|uniref:PucR family transcriptional regulator n=1 Tax=Nocardioides sp. Kera G14 TaxID=2884264 RepID=UPI001D0F977F|nr:helix-turn-helix domain-containing protein [Nocardioides sp. Kera G14]UDY25182.1 helix-turn-helix domain-containing protein [Nocardioides sp. Kera G14]
MPQAEMVALVRNSAAEMWEHSAELGAALAEQIAADVPELAGDPVLVEDLANSVVANLREATGRLAQGDLNPGTAVPEAALAYARRLAERGIPASALLRAYRIGQARAQEAVGANLAASGADPSIVIAASQALSAVAFDYVDGISERVVAAHEDARARWEAVGAARGSGLVAALLDDHAERAQLAARELGHRLDQDHVGLVLWGGDRPHPTLTRRPGALVVPVDSTTVWAWLPGDDVRLQELGSPDGAPEGWVAVGDVAAGPDGFVESHRQARRLQGLVAAMRPETRPRVARAGAARLPLLLARDPAAAAQWVHQTLGALALDDVTHARFRDTLRAFLEAGGSYATAADRLGVHRNTVLYRVRRAEEILGRSLREDRLEVETALRVAYWLGRSVLTTP